MISCSWSSVGTPCTPTVYSSCTSASPLPTHSILFHSTCTLFCLLSTSSVDWSLTLPQLQEQLQFGSLYLSSTSFFFLDGSSFLLQPSVFLPSTSLLLHMPRPMWEWKTSLQNSDSFSCEYEASASLKYHCRCLPHVKCWLVLVRVTWLQTVVGSSLALMSDRSLMVAFPW